MYDEQCYCQYDDCVLYMLVFDYVDDCGYLGQLVFDIIGGEGYDDEEDVDGSQCEYCSKYIDEVDGVCDVLWLYFVNVIGVIE